VVAAAPIMQIGEPKSTGVTSKPRHMTMCVVSSLLAAGLLLVTALVLPASFSDHGDAEPRRRLVAGWEGTYPVKFAFQASPNKCWKVKGDTVSNGASLVMWDCQFADSFLVSPTGFGIIRLERDHAFCLNAPGGTLLLQIWDCNQAPIQNIQFSLPRPDAVGFVKSSHKTPMCVDVPSGDSHNGRKMQQWKCGDHAENEQFIVRPTSRCIWDKWQAWSVSQGSNFCKKRRTRKEVPNDGPGMENTTCHARETEVVCCESMNKSLSA